MDLSKDFFFADSSFDIALSFFVLEHLEDLVSFFREVYRILTDSGVYVVTYFPQRRQYVHPAGFKIETYAHTYSSIEKSAISAFFSFRSFSFLDHGHEVGKAYCFTK